MISNGKKRRSTITPLAIVILSLTCLMAFLIPGLLNRLIDPALAISIVIAVGSLTYAVTTIT